jgi:hypothetical protein
MMNFLAILETPLVVVGIAYEVSLAQPADKSNTRAHAPAQPAMKK